jgi:alanine racemase
MISFLDLRAILSWKSFGAEQSDLPVNQLHYDSRLIANGLGGVFFALKTSRMDGHRFIPQAFEKGVCQWVISDPEWEIWLKNKGNQNWISVENPRFALARYREPAMAACGP